MTSSDAESSQLSEKHTWLETRLVQKTDPVRRHLVASAVDRRRSHNHAIILVSCLHRIALPQIGSKRVSTHHVLSNKAPSWLNMQPPGTIIVT